MATVRAAPKRHRHTEQFSGIFPNQYLPQEGGRDGKKPKHKMARKQLSIATTLCEELQASKCIYYKS